MAETLETLIARRFLSLTPGAVRSEEAAQAFKWAFKLVQQSHSQEDVEDLLEWAKEEAEGYSRAEAA